MKTRHLQIFSIHYIEGIVCTEKAVLFIDRVVQLCLVADANGACRQVTFFRVGAIAKQSS